MNDIKSFIQNIIKEDIGKGDLTSLSCIDKNVSGEAKLICKENAVLAGVEMIEMICHYYDKNLKIEILKKDGEKVLKDNTILTIKGKAHSILSIERVILNCLQRMSGIATKTNSLVTMTKKYGTKLLDTRKTTPGIRFMEKWAVKIGGGENHRFGLYDAILIKDNHIDYCKGITNAAKKACDYVQKNKKIPIIIEVRNKKELTDIINLKPKIDRIILDNFNIKETNEAIKFVDGLYPLETSGNISEKNIIDYAKTGVNYISIGALTHSVKNIDMSLQAEVL